MSRKQEDSQSQVFQGYRVSEFKASLYNLVRLWFKRESKKKEIRAPGPGVWRLHCMCKALDANHRFFGGKGCAVGRTG